LSTVGFGDYHPENEIECMICAFILLFGVAIFSYFMGNCIKILRECIYFFQEDDFGEELTKFFGTLKKFNASKPIDHDLKYQIERYFEYRWNNNKNSVTRGSDNLNLYT
jgi:hypothetical protein